MREIFLRLAQLDAVVTIRALFIGAAAAVLFVSSVPIFQDRFLAYGPRSSASATSTAEHEKKTTKDKDRSKQPTLLDIASACQVPHSWFVSFYITSASLSIFWLVLLPLFRHSLESFAPHLNLDRPSTPFSRQLLANILLLIQGIRRLTECILFQTNSTSKMWVGHWLVGIGFYIGISVAIWIEGLPTLFEHTFTIRDIEVKAPSLRAFCGLLLFTFASGIQHDCHAYLASLKASKATATRKAGDRSDSTAPHYQMPTHPAFSTTLTPHYLAEIVIYLALTILAAPERQWLNTTLLCATVFVVVNLGVTAVGTRRWYATTFGVKAVQGRWAMVPFVL